MPAVIEWRVVTLVLVFRGRGQVPAEIEWRPVTLVKRFAGSAETLTAFSSGDILREANNLPV